MQLKCLLLLLLVRDSCGSAAPCATVAPPSGSTKKPFCNTPLCQGLVGAAGGSIALGGLGAALAATYPWGKTTNGPSGTGTITTTTSKAACTDNCDVCTDGGTCTTCSSGFYLNEDDSSCQACESDCNKCSGASTCTECANNKYLHSNTCVEECPVHFSPRGTSVTGRTCKECANPMCNYCVDTKTCIECGGGAFLLGGDCVPACPDGYFGSGATCQAITTTPIAAPTTPQAITTTPIAAPTTPQACADDPTWTDSQYGDGTSGCNSGDSGGIVANPSWCTDKGDYSAEARRACPAACGLCNEAKTTTTPIAAPTTPQAITTSMPTTPTPLATTKPPTTLLATTTTPQADTPVEPTPPPEVCLTYACPTGFTNKKSSATAFTEANCCQACVDNCGACSKDGSCDTCESGYYLDWFGACKACEADCDTCSDATTCTTCGNNKYLHNDNCVEECPGLFSPSGTGVTGRTCEASTIETYEVPGTLELTLSDPKGFVSLKGAKEALQQALIAALPGISGATVLDFTPVSSPSAGNAALRRLSDGNLHVRYRLLVPHGLMVDSKAVQALGCQISEVINVWMGAATGSCTPSSNISFDVSHGGVEPNISFEYGGAQAREQGEGTNIPWFWIFIFLGMLVAVAGLSFCGWYAYNQRYAADPETESDDENDSVKVDVEDTKSVVPESASYDYMPLTKIP